MDYFPNIAYGSMPKTGQKNKFLKKLLQFFL